MNKTKLVPASMQLTIYGAYNKLIINDAKNIINDIINGTKNALLPKCY